MYNLDSVRSIGIEDVAERLGLTVKRHKSLCPFHDDTHPSMTYSVARNTYKCFVCDAYGDVISLTMKMLGKGFVEACRWLQDEHGVTMTEYKPVVRKPVEEPKVDLEHLARLVDTKMLCKEAEAFLFEERHINRAVVRWLGLSSIVQPMPMQRSMRGSWFNAPALLIPYRDIDGNLVSVQARYLGRDNKPRFQFPRGSKCHVFNLPILKMLKQDEPLYVTEGVSDCLAMLSAGHKAIAIPSATLLKADDLQPLAEMIRNGWCGFMHIYPDRDEPGERLFQHLLSVATSIGACLIRHELPEGCKDFGEWWGSLTSPSQREGSTPLTPSRGSR